jgi:hypothetical protein
MQSVSRNHLKQKPGDGCQRDSDYSESGGKGRNEGNLFVFGRRRDSQHDAAKSGDEMVDGTTNYAAPRIGIWGIQ